MSRKRGKKHKAAVEAIPDDILAEGSGPVGRVGADTIATVEDVVTTDDIATTDDVVTADDVVATTADPDSSADDAAAESEDLAGGAADVTGDDLTGDADDVRLEEAGGGEDGEPGGDETDADDAAIVFPTSAATMDAVQLKHLVEALIFASDRPLTVPRLRQLTRVGDVRRLEQALVEISEDYRERGLILQQVSGGYQFRTRTQFSAWVQQLIAGRPVRLSRAQLETLAIIAYRQPITRPEIDDIRGVDSSATLKLLIDRMLIRVLGKREEVGRPMLYGTTKEFLDFFSLGDLRELPTLREYSELTAESRKVMSDRLGLGPDDGDGSGGPGDGGDGDGGSGTGGDGDGGDSGGGGPGEAGGDGRGGSLPGPGAEAGGSVSDDGAAASVSAADLADAAASFADGAALDRGLGAASGADAEPDPASEATVSPGWSEPVASGPPEADAAAAGGSDGASPDGSWPAGSQRFAVIASTDDRPVERPVMKSNVIDAGALDEGLGDAAAGAASHVEPATE